MPGGELNADEYCRHGISLVGLRHFATKHAHLMYPEMTTSDVCHAVIKPITSAPSWHCEAVLVDERPDRRWYKHDYRHETTGETRCCGVGLPDVAPPGTASLCQQYQQATPLPFNSMPGTLLFLW